MGRFDSFILKLNLLGEISKFGDPVIERYPRANISVFWVRCVVDVVSLS
jgi:hypothetical protein